MILNGINLTKGMKIVALEDAFEIYDDEALIKKGTVVSVEDVDDADDTIRIDGEWYDFELFTVYQDDKYNLLELEAELLEEKADKLAQEIKRIEEETEELEDKRRRHKLLVSSAKSLRNKSKEW